MNNWDYAQLTHLAKESGGPQALIENIKVSAISTGRVQGAVIGAASALVMTALGAYLYHRLQKARAIANQSEAILTSEIEASTSLQPDKGSDESPDYPGGEGEVLEDDAPRC